MEKREGKYICKCECGGQVRGIEQFGRLFTWCEKCTLIVKTPKQRKRRSTGFDCNNTESTGGRDPSPF